MTDHSRPQGPAAIGESITAEHDDLSHVIDMVARVETLHGAGYSSLIVATMLEAEGVECPTGGDWDHAAVDEVLRVVDQLRHDAPQLADQVLPEPPAADLSPPASTVPAPLAGSAALASPAVETARANHPVPDIVRHSGRSWSRGRLGSGVIATVAALIVLGIGAGAWWLAGDDGDPGAGAAQDDSTAADAGNSPDTGSSSDTDNSTAPVPVAPSVDDADPADMLAIRIEPAEEAATGGAGAVAAATATIRNDGLLYFEGAFRSQAEADDHVAQAAVVFGADNIVKDYVVDPDAPAPAVANVTLDKPVLFKHGSAEIDPEFLPFLAACGDVLKLNPSITMSIAAYTDSTGDDGFNLELSQRRAQAIVDFYRELDISQGQLVGLGLGEATPVADNTTDDGRAANRRAMLRLMGVLSSGSE